VQAARDAVAAAYRADDPDRARYLDNLSNALRVLGERTWDAAALEEAVQAARDAVAAAYRADDPDRARYLSNLGGALMLYGGRTGDAAALAQAVQVGRDAVAAIRADDPDRTRYLSNLGGALMLYGGRTGDAAALEEAVQVGWDASATSWPARYVNTLVARLGTEDPIASDRPLAAAAEYEVLVKIGHYIEGSLLSQRDANWPDELLPEKGLWLLAALTVDGAREATVRPFFLPREGESFACDCSVDGEHADDCARRTWVHFPLHTPAEATVIRAELVIYHEVAAVHAQLLILPVATDELGGPRAQLIARLTRTFNDLGKLAGRTASVLVSPTASRIIVNGIGFADNPFAISASAADTSALNARQLLYSSHFEVRDGREYNRYDREHRKKATDFETYLRQLAKEGANLYARLFAPQGTDNTVAFSLPSLLRQEASLRGRPPIVQVVDSQYAEHAMLWALVYDLPLGGDVTQYEPCASVREFGPGASDGGKVPPHCPHDEEHRGRGNVLCPFGFWGLSCIVEQPPDVGRDLESVVTLGSDPLSFMIAADGSLDKRLTAEHLKRIRDRLTEHLVSQPSVATENDLASALGPELMDVVYFYCHSGYERRSQAGAVDRYLSLGDYWIEPLNVNMWAMTCWPDPHWPHRHPLVVLNGCHTTEATSGTLNSFVAAFTQWAAASGVVGTEVAIEQGLAGWAMEEMLADLASGATVGEALRHVRWAMLRRGNVMGLAYTPYCLANLALRPVRTNKE